MGGSAFTVQKGVEERATSVDKAAGGFPQKNDKVEIDKIGFATMKAGLKSR